MNHEEALEKAEELQSWLKSVCLDIAEGDVESAEEMYNDVDTVSDLLSDRAFSMAQCNTVDFTLIVHQLLALEAQCRRRVSVELAGRNFALMRVRAFCFITKLIGGDL